MKGNAKILSATALGFKERIIEIEADLSKGLPSFQIVGMGNKAISEARDRVRSAIKNTGLDFPKGRIIVNLAPAEIPKDGAQFDVPIALSLLLLTKQLRNHNLPKALFAGELALDGSIRPIRTPIAIAESAKKNGYSAIFIPKENVAQAQLISGIDIFPITHLQELFLHLKGVKLISPSVKITKNTADNQNHDITIDDIQGQEQAKRAALIAVAGRHNILLSGPPGTGKTMLAKAINNLLTAPTDEEILEITKLHNIAMTKSDIVAKRPFRSPHHSASRTSLIGGGVNIRPGEISLAHHGVLFLDELLEYPRSVLEALRQPLEDHVITINRANGTYTYPANFILIATMNPCPCGYLGDSKKMCTCSNTQILRYQKQLSGPLLDRIDLTINVSRVDHDILLKENTLSNSQHILYKKCIQSTEKIQKQRYKRDKKYNGYLSMKEIQHFLKISNGAKLLLDSASKKLDLSARAYVKVIKVAQTIADLDNTPEILPHHIAESLQYRQIVVQS